MKNIGEASVGAPYLPRINQMTRFRKFLAVCAAIAAGLYIAYLLIFPTAYLRYRLTLDVDVDGVTHTGSGVVEIAYQPPPDWLAGIGGGTQFLGRMRGYGITVDLGRRGLMYVVDSQPFLLDPETGRLAFPKAPSLNMLPFAAYGESQSQSPSSGLAAVRELRGKKSPVDIPPEMLPMIVRFRSIGSQEGIDELDPRDLAATYGPGVRLAGARFEFTSDRVSPMPRSWPKWLADATSAHQFAFWNPRGVYSNAIWATAFKGGL